MSPWTKRHAQEVQYHLKDNDHYLGNVTIREDTRGYSAVVNPHSEDDSSEFAVSVLITPGNRGFSRKTWARALGFVADSLEADRVDSDRLGTQDAPEISE